jgi:hypothetical protein
VNNTRTAFLGLLTTIVATLATVVTGDLAVTLLSIAVGLFRLAVAFARRPRSPHLYRPRFLTPWSIRAMLAP